MMHEKSAGHSLNLHLNNRTRSLSTKSQQNRYVKNKQLIDFMIFIKRPKKTAKTYENLYDFLQE